MTQQVPFAPARAIIKHLQASKNRIARYVAEQEKVRQGLRELRGEVDQLHLQLELSEHQDTIPLLVAGFEAGICGASDIIVSIERVIAIENHFQYTLSRWLKGMPPLPKAQPPAHAPYVYEPTKARQVPTPKHEVKGHYVDLPAPDEQGNHPTVQGHYVDPATGQVLGEIKPKTDKSVRLERIDLSGTSPAPVPENNAAPVEPSGPTNNQTQSNGEITS